MNKATCKLIFKRFAALNPNPTTELIYHSPFELLIAVILSAQATDVSVNKATVNLFAIANTPKKILSLGEEWLKAQIKTIGLFNSKARHIIQTCEYLMVRHNGIVPDTREELEALPGVGRKTANVVLNTAFNQPTIAVDTHIFRVANRTGMAVGKTPLAVEVGLLKIIDRDYILLAHHWLILHGRYVCLARKPLCSTCVIKELCDFRKSSSA